MADLADASISGRDVIELREDTPARGHLLRSQTLSEVRRDQMAFYHDVLRDWAVGARLAEDPAIIAKLDLGIPISPRVARGVEFAARFALEAKTDCQGWLELLGRLSPEGSHGSWRRHALLAIVRSELSPGLLECCKAALLANDGELLRELITAIVAVETVSSAELMKDLPSEPSAEESIPRSLRFATTSSGPRLLQWCIHHAAEMPVQAIAPVVKLVEVMFPFVANAPKFGAPIAEILFGWLLQLDVRNALVTIPQGVGPDRAFRVDRGRLVGELRTMALVLSSQAPDQLKAYLRALTAESDHYKVKEIRPLSTAIARAAPRELADLVVASLVEPEDDEERGRNSRYSALSFADSDYIPPSPAQPPFLDLLDASPEVGLGLIRRLVDESVGFRFAGRARSDDGITLALEDGPRSFPFIGTYFWSRDQAREYSTASGLMALEAWAHARSKRATTSRLCSGTCSALSAARQHISSSRSTSSSPTGLLRATNSCRSSPVLSCSPSNGSAQSTTSLCALASALETIRRAECVSPNCGPGHPAASLWNDYFPTMRGRRGVSPRPRPPGRGRGKARSLRRAGGLWRSCFHGRPCPQSR